MPDVLVRRDGHTERVPCRLVVGADGRGSATRSWGGFDVVRDPENLMIAGLLVSGSRAPDDSVYVGAGVGARLLLAPLGGDRARVYLIYRKASGVRSFDGEAGVLAFLDACRSAGVPREWLAEAKAEGPLAQFSGADHYVDHPARARVTLIGDAAASPDPSWGTGLSLTLLDVLHLSRCLTRTDDWRAALEDYAREHDRYYHALRAVEGWFTGLIWTDGPEADARRAVLMPRLRNEPTTMPDIIGLGPESPIDEGGTIRWKGEAVAGI
jgi:2-polyprenyl-6-methoxyphenol hydroxylase-like FAD-dependent oxidoreductase